jgi:Uma2 family endonuclease
VEVLSPSTARPDRTSKFQLYERLGVREYWLADPAGKYLEVFTLTENGYNRLGAFGPEDTFTSPVLARDVSLTTVF